MALVAGSLHLKAFQSRRCLVPVDGFFEWEKVGKERRPYMIAMLDRRPFTLAGLWENWKKPETGEWERRFTIITTDANELVAELHDRMPVIIAPEDRERWLKGPNPQELLKPYPSEEMTMWAVSPKLNSPKNDSPGLLEPIISEPDGAAKDDVVRANEGEPERSRRTPIRPPQRRELERRRGPLLDSRQADRSSVVGPDHRQRATLVLKLHQQMLG